VTGENLSAEQIVNELEWIIPCNNQWDLRPTDDGAFKVLFPSKVDLARMTKIINVPVSWITMFLHFEDWSATDVDKFYLTPVWVKVHGVCYKERCDYHSLFGVGSLIGKTKKWTFTRTHSMARMLVEVTRVELIPTTTVDHTYDGEGYELILKVEGENSKINLMYICKMLILQRILRMWKLKARMIKPLIPKVDRLSLLQLVPTLPKANNVPAKQAQNLSLPVVRVGQIDCVMIRSTPS
jgi:hypothetical protein